MTFIKNIVETYKLETALVILGLSWLTNPVFIAAFLALIVYYYADAKRSKKRRSLIIPNFKYYHSFL